VASAGISESLTVRPRALTLALAAGLVLVYAPVLDHAVGVWRYDQELTFGFLVPPFTLALLWLRRSSLRNAVSAGSDLGLVVFLGGLGLLVAASRVGVHALAGASFLPTILGATVFLLGAGVARLVFLPAALLTVSLSLYRGLLSSLGFALQEITATMAAALANVVGVPVQQSGVHLFVGSFHFVVTQACSGMDSLLALLCLGLAFVGLVRASLARRAALVALILPIVLAANVLRVVLVLTLSQTTGPAIATGLLHELLSAAVFVVATLLFGLTGIGLRCVPQLGVRLSSSS
jgi:exosortase